MDLKKMIERAQALNAEKRTILDAALTDSRQPTDEERSRIEAIDTDFGTLKMSIAEARNAQELDKQAEETRAATGTAPATLKVTHEAAIYERGSSRSYVIDSYHASLAGHPDKVDAEARMARHERQLESLLVNGSSEARQIESVIQAEYRSNPDAAERQLDQMRARGAQSEQRDVAGVTTAPGSGGSFVPPIYLLNDYAPYKQAGRSFINAANNMPLPSSGMVINIPTVSNAATVGVHAAQNTALPTSLLTTSNVTANVQMVTGQMLVSVEDIERQAYSGGFDAIVFDQLTRAYNAQADQIAVAQALAGAGAVTYTGTFAMQTFYSKVNGAQAAIRTTAGIFGNPSHLFLQPTRWSYIASQFDTAGRPIVVPNVNGPHNAVAAGNPTGNVGIEGDTGYWLAGLRTLQDANIVVPGTGADQAIVADMSSVLVMESGVKPLEFDQTYANQGSVLLQVRGYLAVAALYPLAVQAISGTAMGTITF